MRTYQGSSENLKGIGQEGKQVGKAGYTDRAASK